MTTAPCLDPTRSADFTTNIVDYDGKMRRLRTKIVTFEELGIVVENPEGEFYPLELDRYDFLKEES